MTSLVWEVYILGVQNNYIRIAKGARLMTNLVSRGWLFYTPSAKWVGAETGALFACCWREIMD